MAPPRQAAALLAAAVLAARRPRYVAGLSIDRPRRHGPSAVVRAGSSSSDGAGSVMAEFGEGKTVQGNDSMIEATACGGAAEIDCKPLELTAGLLVGASVLALGAAPALAELPTASDAPLCSLDDGDTAFMMFAATVVMMQTPAMGLAQAGMIRRKNSLSMLMQVLFGMVIGSLLWTSFGFSLAFGPSSETGLIGDPLYYSFLQNVPTNDCLPQFADSIPGTLFASFQMMFALMAPLIVTGAWAEKMTFEAFLIFILLWPIAVYYPLVHWIWSPDGWLNQMGVLDFAGGLVIHSSTGVAGFVVSLLLQRRKLLTNALAHHNLPISFVGAALVWSGWYSFNAGSAYAADTQASVALYNTHISACSGSLVWSLLNYSQSGKWSMVECISGAFAGLAGVTAASGYVEPWAAVIIGTFAGFWGFYSVRFFKGFLDLDDVLDVTSLQGTAGVLGSLAVGIFSTSTVSGGNPSHDGIFYGGSSDLFLVQLLACAVVLAWSGFWTYCIVSLMKATVGIDVSPEVEELGLDLVQIGEQAYDQRLDLLQDIGPDALTGLLNEACASGDTEEVQRLIRNGADPSASDYDGRCPIHLAAAHGRNAVLDFLYTQHRVDLTAVDNFGTTPMLEAVRNNRKDTVAWLRQRGVKLKFAEGKQEQAKAAVFDICSRGDVSALMPYVQAGLDFDFSDYDLRTPLTIAASEGKEFVVQELLKAGAPPFKTDRWGQTALDCAREAGHLACAGILENAGLKEAEGDQTDASAHAPPEKRTAPRTTGSYEVDQNARSICTAAADGDVDELQRLLNKGVSVNLADYDMRTPLHIASALGKENAVELLCSHPQININAMDRWHNTPLTDAARQGHTRVASLLRSNGAVSINRNLGYRLCSAAASGDIAELKQAALNEGANLNAADYDARTALHLAASEGQLEVMKLLLDNGASPSPRDRYNFTPLDDALREGQKEAAVFLREWAI